MLPGQHRSLEENVLHSVLRSYDAAILRRHSVWLGRRHRRDLREFCGAAEHHQSRHQRHRHCGGAKIGKNVVISHQVTIGRNRGLAPVIGDGVYIGPGAKIFGGIRVGDNARIGANCVVFQDVPDNATIVLGKPRVIEHDVPVEYYDGDACIWKNRCWPEDGGR